MLWHALFGGLDHPIDLLPLVNTPLLVFLLLRAIWVSKDTRVGWRGWLRHRFNLKTGETERELENSIDALRVRVDDVERGVVTVTNMISDCQTCMIDRVTGRPIREEMAHDIASLRERIEVLAGEKANGLHSELDAIKGILLPVVEHLDIIAAAWEKAAVAMRASAEKHKAHKAARK